MNTLLLLCSGATVTYSHHAITAGKKADAVLGLVFTVVLAVLFTALQAFEYVSATFTISDGIYGSTFFMATGFHGFHVCLGAIILTIMTIRGFGGAFSEHDHFGLAAGSWYWHFVDVVWILLVLVVYVF